MTGRAPVRALITASVLLGAQLLLFTSPALAAEIGSSGPLTRVIVSPELNCQVAHRDDASFELFPSFSEVGSCGTFVAIGVSLAGALAAWVLLAFLRAGSPESDLTTIAIEAATVTTVIAGLENAVFAMLPLRFPPGAAVFAWNRRIWALLIGLGLFGFAHVLLNPSAGYLADSTRTSFLTLIVLLAAFGLASVLFWAWFRFRPRPARAQ